MISIYACRSSGSSVRENLFEVLFEPRGACVISEVPVRPATGAKGLAPCKPEGACCRADGRQADAVLSLG